jgi:hypothetical protein
VAGLFFWHAVKAPHSLDTERDEGERLLKAEAIKKDSQLDQLNLEVQRMRDAKPNLDCRFNYGGEEASLSVTNNGVIAEVWASLRIQGSVSGRATDIFARWTHTNDHKVSIAKGQTCRLILALSKRDSRTPGILFASWEIPYASHTGWEMTCSTHTSIIEREDAQAADIHLYVGVFSNPDCAEVIAERHIVLHASSAEELSN